ncbi:CAP domain-containing protein [Litchfieldia salsa]|uniref:Uncharacterized protein, YkwD family n=1 Tax=Litchfieldia salsa TaxID=930152 RepID=A0A1H0T5Z3_9BACI|nr:CAP domain-containing protein [Litchfieldia salsa]SDP49467.1 uncharacterized protein, YkwD family [Litchfieldia salsa]
MITRKFYTILISVFLLALVGCNVDNDQSLGDRDNDFGTLDNRNDNDLNPFNNNNNNGEIFDEREDRNMNELTDVELNDLNGDINNPFTDISADKTDTPSKKYPHTKAIQIQEAKFKYVKLDKNQIKEFQNKWNKQGTTAQEIPGAKQQAAPAPNQEKQQAAPTPKQEPAAPAPTEQQAAPAPKQETKAPAQTQAAGTISEFERKVIDLTNAERSKNGLPNLQADTQLSGVAREKSNDMQKNNYFSHTSPTYGSPFDMMRDFNVTYKTAGENIAQGQQTPEQVVQAWMNSEGHRKNILSKDFTHIGVGYQQSGHHWTQMFIGK